MLEGAKSIGAGAATIASAGAAAGIGNVASTRVFASRGFATSPTGPSPTPEGTEKPKKEQGTSTETTESRIDRLENEKRILQEKILANSSVWGFLNSLAEKFRPFFLIFWFSVYFIFLGHLIPIWYYSDWLSKVISFYMSRGVVFEFEFGWEKVVIRPVQSVTTVMEETVPPVTGIVPPAHVPLEVNLFTSSSLSMLLTLGLVLLMILIFVVSKKVRHDMREPKK